MKFRPCIDIHNGEVKQIVGGSLSDVKGATENFVSSYDAAYYAAMYKSMGLAGGHIIMLNPAGTKEYDACRAEAIKALGAYPDGMQIGGGLTRDNCMEYIEAGATHCIFTSYIFRRGQIAMDVLKELGEYIGRHRIVLDLSCRRRGNDYYVVTDRWQKYTDTKLTPAIIEELYEYADEFLIHGVDCEGRRQGIEKGLIEILSETGNIPITYAGGIRDMEDIELIRRLGKGNIDFTVGSGLDIFGGNIKIKEISCNQANCQSS